MKTKKKIKALIITLVSIALAVQLLVAVVLLLPIGIGFLIRPFDYTVTYSISECVIEDNVEYTVSKLFKKARVSEIILTKEKTTYEIVIPERLENGALVEGIGYPTTSIDLFGYSFENYKIKGYASVPEEEVEFEEVTDYYITIVFGENIKKADSVLYLAEEPIIRQLLNTDEYVRLNFMFQVSPENEYYYSQDGKLYEK